MHGQSNSEYILKACRQDEIIENPHKIMLLLLDCQSDSPNLFNGICYFFILSISSGSENKSLINIIKKVFTEPFQEIVILLQYRKRLKATRKNNYEQRIVNKIVEQIKSCKCLALSVAIKKGKNLFLRSMKNIFPKYEVMSVQMLYFEGF